MLISHALLNWLLEEMPIGAVWTYAGADLQLNAEAARIFRARRRQMSLHDWVRSFTAFAEAGRTVPPDQHPLLSALRGDAVARRRMEIVCADGGRVEVMAHAYPFSGAEETAPGAVCICEDISWAAERERQCDEWLAALGHEVRGATHVVDLAIRNARARTEKAPALARQDLDIALRNVVLLRRLAKDFDETARLSGFHCVPTAFELAPAVRTLLAEGAAGSTHAISLRAEEVRVHADPDRVQQILLNLLLNAAKYARPGVLELGIRRDGGRAVLWLKDEGPGIAQREQTHLFQHYGRLPSKEEGSGLGLWLSRELALKMGGDLWLTSAEGAPTTFFFAMPLAPEEIQSVRHPQDARPA
jgi:signal transduction histidine kinase